ncbi:hypothetical protein PHAVU_011G087500 [Phaseolus vulgaris]|uniref:Core Histone H2A/H2B/H3 domain-containing protein n=1 Tax=Phaseolus vulgaris TaxID=3885 RepID=V7AJS3_PHAVU|nr:hypothetical protein PHAVU_011G087500g [Phaseolus vulgaris]ESW04346.1 hypothetical protein PHAVU_011G087500g [Phaseolus vulgaris]
MAPKRAQKLVVRSTKKVVESSVQVSVVSSSSRKRQTRGNKDNIQTEEAVGEEKHVMVIPIQEGNPQAQKDSSTSAMTNENKGEQENSVQDDGVQNEEKKKKGENEEVKEEKKGRFPKGSNGKEKKLGKKKGRRSAEGYQRYVYRVLKQVHPEMGISSKCMTILNNLMNDMFERLAGEASKLKDYTGHMTLSSREIQGAVKLVLPGELGKHAIAEGVKAVNNFTSYDA